MHQTNCRRRTWLIIALVACFLPHWVVSDAQSALTDDLVAHYTFDETTGSVLKEETGKGTNGELFNFPTDNSQWTKGQVGNALSFDGVDDYVIAPDYTLATTSMSVSAWVKANDGPTWASIVKNWGNSIVGQFHFGLGPGTADTLNVFVTQDDGAAFNAGTDADDLTLDEWHHVGFVADAAKGNVSLFKDGAIVDERPYDGTFTSAPASTALGIGVKTDDSGSIADPTCCAAYWNGLIDDLAIWTRALTTAEMTSIRDNGLAGKGIQSAGGIRGDFSGNGVLDAADVDALGAAARAGNHPPAFDLNADAKVDIRDRNVWVEDLRKTYFGDANLDGEFNSGDLVRVFQQGEYEDGVAGNSGWSDGDFDGNGEFDSSDFVSAFQGGGFENGPRPGVVAVPEPATGTLSTLLFIGLATWRAQRVRQIASSMVSK